MFDRSGIRRGATWLTLTALLLTFATGLTCPPGTSTTPGGNPVPAGNRPPQIVITGIATPSGNTIAQQGQPVMISFTGADGEDTSLVRVFASQSSAPNSTTPIINILSGFQVGPGSGSGQVTWNTTGVPVGPYSVFAEIDDQTFNPLTGSGNPPVRVTGASLVQVAPLGSQPLTVPPQIVFLDPEPNIGLSTDDELTVRYIYADTDSPVTVTLLLDKDKNPANDDINNPGDPLLPSTNIVILPTAPRLSTDPTFDGDPPPPDDPANPPTQPDSLELRTNPRSLPATAPSILPFPGAPLVGDLKEYRFKIDLSQIPVRSQPYNIRATISDGSNVVHRYATGSLTISSLASGIVDTANLGFSLAGARLQGFAAYENLGTDFVDISDLDLDGVEELMIASRFASPRNRFQPGAAYLIYGRRKTPFPPDTNGNGLPDVIGPTGEVVDFPAVPDFLPNPYDSRNVGRFGGTVSINSVGSFFRGTVYAMPKGHDPYAMVPATILDPEHTEAFTAGLMSITRIDLTEDDIPDLVFGLPHINGAVDNVDADPVDGCGTASQYGDGHPTSFHCLQPPTRDDLVNPLPPSGQRSSRYTPCNFDNPHRDQPFTDPLSCGPVIEVNMGLVIVVDGSNDIRNNFSVFLDATLAGQNDPLGALDDGGLLNEGDDLIPRGMRFRGGWLDNELDDTFGGEGRVNSDSEFGRTVARLRDFDNRSGDELLISSPGYDDPMGLKRGRVSIWLSGNYLDDEMYGGAENAKSLPGFRTCTPSCGGLGGNICCRDFIPRIGNSDIIGELEGDRFGYADEAGDINQDGTNDVAAGSPGADRNGRSDCGVVYILAIPRGGTDNIDLAIDPAPRIEIIGSHDDDQFGLRQGAIEDLNGDGIADVAFSAPSYDDLVLGPDTGYVGVVFGNRPITGEEGFFPEDVGLEQGVGNPGLNGIRFVGVLAGHRAGNDFSSAGDFNNDGYGDLLISCPGENRTLSGQTRFGVAYLIFGGPHLDPTINGRSDNVFNLSEVGSAVLPGIVFVGRIAPGAELAPPPLNGIPNVVPTIETVGGVGDVDGDGFDDILIGAPHVDFVFPNVPSQRRIDAGEVYLIYGSNFGTNNLCNVPGYTPLPAGCP